MKEATLKYRLLGLILLLELFLAGTATGQTQLPPAVKAELAAIEKAYNIEISAENPSFPVKSAYGTIDGKVATSGQLEIYIKLFVPEFTIYPASLVKRSQLKRVVLCTELAFAGQLRSAIPDWEHDTLYLDVTRGWWSKSYLRKVLHHEFFHIIDYRDDGNLYQDKTWSALNASGFKYGSGGQNAQDNSSSSVLTDQYPGFLNYYSTTGVEEDKAEVFAILIVEPAYIEERIKKDAVLQAKVTLMKKQLNKFCPELNNAFWEKLRRMRA
jgi:putative zinc-binding metallo-peptidase